MDKGGTAEATLRKPNGGGAVSSIGSDFQVNINTGTGGYSIPIDLPDGYRSQSPQLALQYSTGSGHGDFGLGWSLGTLAITRDSRRGIPHFNDNDTFLLAGEPLLSMGEDIYRPEVDRTFQRVRRLTTGWEVTDRQGTRFLLGTAVQSQERHPDIVGEHGVVHWLLDRIIDSSGNETTLSYLEDGHRRYLHRMEYAIFRVELEYESRPDIYVSRRSGYARRTRWRGTRISVHNTDLTPSLLRHYSVTYQVDPLALHSLLASVQLQGFLYEPEEHTEQAPPLTFSYSAFEPHKRALHSFSAQADAPPSLNSVTVDLVDLDGFGLPGVIEANLTTHRYWPNRGGSQWGVQQRLSAFPQAASLADNRVRFGDMNGNGRVDLLVSEGALSGYYPAESGRSWGRMQRYGHQRPTFNAKDGRVRWLDADGDGRVDAMVADNGNFLLYEGKGAQGWAATPRAIPRRRNDPHHPEVSFTDPRVRQADMTGDGLLDTVRLFAHHLEIWPSFGAGKWDARQVLTLPGEGPARFQASQCFLIDINGDGFTDVVYIDSEAIYVWVNQCGAAMAQAQIIRYAPVASPETVRTVDMLGIGTAGLLFGLSYRADHREPYRFIDFTAGIKPYLLNHIDNGVGGVTAINYGASSSHRQRDRDSGHDWSTFLPTAVQVINSVHRRDTVSGEEKTVSHRYHDGHYDADARRFIGFGHVEVEENHGPQTLVGLSHHYFHLGRVEDGLPLSSNEVGALRGLLYRKEQFGLDGGPQQDKAYLVEWTEWSVRSVAVSEEGRNILFPHPTRRGAERYERSQQANSQITELSHDNFGNVILERRISQPANPADPSQTLEYHATYINDQTRWIFGLPLRRTLLSGGQRLDDVIHYYDGLSEGRVNAGLLTRRQRLAFTSTLLADVFSGVTLPDLATLGYQQQAGESDVSEYWFNEYHCVHNTRGDVVEHRDPLGQATTIEFDSSHELYPVRVTNPAGHVYQANYHARLGAITSLIDPNEQTTAYTYTPLGRVRSEIRPGDSAALPTVEFEYHTAVLPVSTIMIRRRESGAAANRWSVSYHDGHGNVVQTRHRLDDGSFHVGAREQRDLRDQVVARYPAFVSANAPFDPAEGPSAADMTYRYDPLQRIAKMVDGAGRVARAEFGPDTFTYFDTQDTDVTSPFADTPRVQRIDPAGRLISVTEKTGSGDQSTFYRYDAADRMTEVEDASATRLLSQTFDYSGRKIRIDHRDAGVRRFLHDARGKLVLYIDPQSRPVRYRFDVIGRKLGVDFDETEVEHFSYDTGSGSHLIGRLAEAVDGAGRQAFSYDNRGRVAQSARIMAGHEQPFSYLFSYDPDDRRRQVTYPDGANTEYTYDAMGRLASISGLIDQVHYDERGRRSRVVYSSGLEAQHQYDASLGRLEEHALVNPATSEALFHQRLSYDSADNITAIDDLRPRGPDVGPFSRSYEYDALDRMTRAQGGPVPNPYDHHFEFDAIGNMTLNEPARPEPLWHEGAQLRGFSDAGGPQTLYNYDANGCLQTGPGMTLQFDRRDMLAQVVRQDGMQIEFAYDYAGRRVRKLSRVGLVTQDTLFIGESFEVLPDGTQIRYVTDPDGGATLVVRQGADTQILHHDFMGNTVLVRNSVSGHSQAVRYLPYGEVHNPGSSLGEILFAGKRIDIETGLYYFRMRYYDPAIGRFISPDPIAVVSAERGRLRPLSLNPYVYALDNPQRYSDPNGLWSFWEGFLTVVLVVAIVVATALTFGAAGVIALAVGAAVGALVGGLTTGSVDGALAGAMMGFGIVATVLSGLWLGGLFAGLSFVAAGIQALGFIPGIRQSGAYKDVLGYASWFNPWSWPGHIVGGAIFIINAIVYGVAYAVTWGDPPEWADMSVSFEQGMVVTEGGWIRPGRAWNFGAFTTLNPNDAGVADPATRELILRHERGHMLNNAYFGVLQVGRIGASSQDESFWEQMAESNVNPFVPGLTGGDDERRLAGGRRFGDVPWWNP